ncbi:MAG: 1-(5-phosphoribosyl)-5-[(5-phosphoribosylamino)methylideneamino]imidazole-4-carboxamide isomerase [Eubacteriaceae bacterium]|jgi:phosphoribosylformimino-5-aminoimidazole carboxamide ribotide isomerase|nr:1-(5-phosphoribosyl)-5-[(5-phosphoribosylamino)methylideneamino]imidazole-4-carboxamide isomerase [Eubacteriaceae bacterium]
MILFPAIDILGGNAVRLSQGDYSKATVYNSDPIQMAELFKAQGAKRLHIVDLDAARTGVASNLSIIKDICETTGLFVQAGGGVRSLKAAESLIAAGASRFVVGTKAVADLGFIADLASEFPGKAAVSLDSKGGRVMASGWLDDSGVSLDEAACLFEEIGISAIIATDISKDGMLNGTSASFYKRLNTLTRHQIIASGGISSISDLFELAQAGISGAIIGKALYEGRISLSSAIGEIEAD